MLNVERLERMQRAMQDARLDALVLRLPENVLLLSGFWPMIGATYLLFPQDAAPHAIVPHCYEMEAARSLWHGRVHHYTYGVLGAEPPHLAVAKILAAIAHANPWKRIGFEERFDVAAPSWNTAEFLVPSAQHRELLSSVFPAAELLDVSALIQL